jgi:hypothetical protein
VPIVLKSGSFKVLEPPRPVEACNGVALPLHIHKSNIYYWDTKNKEVKTVEKENKKVT